MTPRIIWDVRDTGGFTILRLLKSDYQTPLLDNHATTIYISSHNYSKKNVMRTSIAIMRRLLLIIILFGFFGCAAFLEASRFSGDMQLFIGKKTYEEFFSEYGQPAKIINGENVFLAVWLLEIPNKRESNSADPDVKAFHCCEFKILTLYFNNDTKLLKEIRYVVPL